MNGLTLHQKYALATAKAHAEIRNEISERKRYGQPVPKELYSKLNSLETEARALLPAEGLQTALQISNHYAAKLDQQSQQRYEQQISKNMQDTVSRAAQKITAGMYGEKGLTPEQFNQLKRGEKLKIPNPKKSLFSTESFEKIISNGKTPLKQRIDQLDGLSDIKRMRTPEQYQAALKSAGVTEEMMNFYDKNSLAYAMAKRQEDRVKDAPDYEEVETLPEFQRKAQIADNWMEHNQEVPITEEIHEDYLNHVEYDRDGNEQPSLTQTLSRALEYHEREALNNE